MSGKLEILIEALLFWDILEPNPDTGITIVFELSYREFYEIYLKELNKHRTICLNRTLLIRINMIHFLWLRINRIIKRTWVINKYFSNRNGDQFMIILIFQKTKSCRTKINQIYRPQSHHKLLVKLKRLFHRQMTKQFSYQMELLVKLQASLITHLQS